MVRAEKYWGAIYSISGASGRLDTALRGSQAAINDNYTDPARDIWNRARFPLHSAEHIGSILEALIAISRLTYYQLTCWGTLAQHPRRKEVPDRSSWVYS